MAQMKKERKVIRLKTPISNEDIKTLNIGDMVLLSGYIYCGRDAVLPKICELVQTGEIEKTAINLKGSVIFHTAVSPAGVGPTSSNKLEIESSFPTLSKAGVKLHLGKGAISSETIKALDENNTVYAVIPPVTALLGKNTLEQRVVAFAELGMEALHELKVEGYPIIIAAIHGESIYR